MVDVDFAVVLRELEVFGELVEVMESEIMGWTELRWIAGC